MRLHGQGTAKKIRYKIVNAYIQNVPFGASASFTSFFSSLFSICFRLKLSCNVTELKNNLIKTNW